MRECVRASTLPMRVRACSAVAAFNSDGSVNLSNCGALKLTESVDIHGSRVVLEGGFCAA